MSKYHSLRIAGIRRETPECVSVHLEVPHHLQEMFRFKPGQYLNVRAVVDGEELRKSYSICSDPGDPELAVAVKWVYNGKFSTFANHRLQPGDHLEVMPPEGKFTLPDDLPDDATVVFFAAGSGITPIISMLRHFLETRPHGSAILFYSNKTSDSIIFRDELEALKNKHMTRFSMYPVMTREVTGVDLLSGRIDKAKCEVFARHLFDVREVNACFICGPELMIEDVSAALTEMGMNPAHIKFELFGTTRYPVTERPADVVTADDTLSKVTIRIDGHEADFTIPYNGRAILDIARDSGLDIPYSCKGGVCSTCRAQVVMGAVHMDIQYGLEPDEVDAGHVLTCQAHPRSEKLVLDFDIL
jgi:ring-1,2-phenylacetyl-CoA epoxidase subunit PaaE